MREIKGRGFYPGDSEFGAAWVFGSLVREEYGYSIMELDTRICWTVEPDSVGQFTGIKDKNGKEIYEGDIVQSDDAPSGEIMYWTTCAQFIVSYQQEDDDGRVFYETLNMYEMDFAVIGNSYENPELIEGDTLNP